MRVGTVLLGENGFRIVELATIYIFDAKKA